MLRLFFIIFATIAYQAQAGAWMKEPGHGFLSFSGEFSETTDLTGRKAMNSVYSSFLEYGVSEKLTMGYDGTWSEFADKAILYARVPLRQIDGKMRYALEFGAGKVNGNGAAYLGLMLGRGVRLGDHFGWLSIESRATWDLSSSVGNYKIDGTLGVSLKNNDKIVGQLQNEYSDLAGLFSKASLSYVYSFGSQTYIETGVVQGLVNISDTSLKIGLWREF